MDTTPFTFDDLTIYAAILDGCSNGRPCRWTPDGGDTIREGVMRPITNANRGANDPDIRSYEIQVSGIAEHFLPITTIAELLRTRNFFIK